MTLIKPNYKLLIEAFRKTENMLKNENKCKTHN